MRPEENVPWHGYGTLGGAEELAVKFRELTLALMESSGIAGFCYTQLTDTGQETNGLLTAAREFKVDPAAIRAVLNLVPAAVPGDLTTQQQQKLGAGAGGALGD